MTTALPPLTSPRRAVMESIMRGEVPSAAEHARRARAELLDAGLVVFRDGRYLLTVEGRRRLERALLRLAAPKKSRTNHRAKE